MQLVTFNTLCDWLAINTDLKGSRIAFGQRVRGIGKEVSIEEKLMIFFKALENPPPARFLRLKDPGSSPRSSA
jgi:hypothetical protein